VKKQQKINAFLKHFLTPWKKSLKYSISFFYDVKKIVKKQQKNDVFEAFFNVVKKKIVKK